MSMIDKLRAELTVDPLGRNYAGLTDTQVVQSLRLVNRTLTRTSMSGDLVFQQTNGTEFGALTDAKKSQWLAFCGRDAIDPAAPANVSFVQYVFGAGAATLTSLAASRQYSVSRADELGLGAVFEGDVARARA